MTAKRSHPRIPILLRLEPEELALIDQVRGDTPRTQWIVAQAMDSARLIGEYWELVPALVRGA